MARHTYASALPASGAAADILTAALARDTPATLKSLAKDAGVSAHAASRAARDLIESGLLHGNRAEGYSFNWEHTEAATLARLVWRYSGIRRPVASPHWLAESRPRDIDRWLELVQDESALAPGPDLVRTRELVDDLAVMINRLREIQAIAQDGFYEWADERLRDVIHLSISLGEATSAAAGQLTAAAGATAQGESDPRQVQVAGAPWVRATLMVNTEAHRVQSLLSPLVRGIHVGAAMREHRRRALSLAGDAGRISQARPQEALAALAAITVEICAAEELFADPDHARDRLEPFHHLGGTPAQDEVGTAGDMVLAVRAHTLLEGLIEILAFMAAQEPVTQWRSQHLELSQRHPLLLKASTLQQRHQHYRAATTGTRDE